MTALAKVLHLWASSTSKTQRKTEDKSNLIYAKTRHNTMIDHLSVRKGAQTMFDRMKGEDFTSPRPALSATSPVRYETLSQVASPPFTSSL